jgi:uncharacterized protein YjeT (DUF2065 family)
MTALAILCVIGGLLIIVSRGPLIVAPRPTIAFYRRIFTTNARVRMVGLLIAGLAAAAFLTPPGGQTSEFWLQVIGGVMSIAAVWLFVAPGTYRTLAYAVLDFFEDSTDTAILRAVGLLAVAIGVWFVYLGLRVV